MPMIYAATLAIPPKFFPFLPRKVQHAMLENVIDVVNQTGTVTMVGDDSYKIIIPWCVENCAHRFCWDGESHTIMFESAEDCTLFMTARPQVAGEWPIEPTGDLMICNYGGGGGITAP